MPRDAPRSRAIRLVTRTLPGDVVSALAEAAVRDMPPVRIRGPVKGTAAEVRRRHEEAPVLTASLRRQLSEDVGSMAALMGKAAQASRIALRLEAITGNACSRFHVDAVPLRLLTTYVGPGTEYLPGGWSGSLDADGLAPGAEVLRMQAGDYAIIAGSPDGGHGLLHRSPTLAGSGRVRLFLSVDASA